MESKEQKKQRSSKFLGMSPCCSCLVMMGILVLCSLIGYLLGVRNGIEPPEQTVNLVIKSDSTLMEIIRNQTKVEMEMLRIIGEKQNTTPTIKNNIIMPKRCCQPQIVNSFNNNIVKDSLK